LVLSDGRAIGAVPANSGDVTATSFPRVTTSAASDNLYVVSPDRTPNVARRGTSFFPVGTNKANEALAKNPAESA